MKILTLPQELIDEAEKIKLENQARHPGQFNKHTDPVFDGWLAERLQIPMDLMDWVYFSCCKGTVEHVDKLKNVVKWTIVVPIILPRGVSTLITHRNGERYVYLMEQKHVGSVIQFNHTEPHQLKLEDTTSGCVFIMATCRLSTNAPRPEDY